MPVEWFYAKGDQQYGPVSAKGLKHLAATGELQPDDLVWREGMAEWAEANHVKKLFRRIQPPDPELPDLEPPTGSATPGGAAAPPMASDSAPAPASESLDAPPAEEPEAPDVSASKVSASGGVPAAPASAFGAAVPTRPGASPAGAVPSVPSGAVPLTDSVEVLPGVMRDSQGLSATNASIGPPAPGRTVPPRRPPPGQSPPAQSPWLHAAEATPPKIAPAGRHFFDSVLDGVRPGLTPAFIDSFARIFSVLGHFGLYAAMMAGAVFPVIVGASGAKVFVFGLVWILMLLVLQYVAERFTAVLRRLNRQTGNQLSSTAFPDSFAVLAMVTGLAALAGLVMLAVRDGAYLLIFLGIVVFVVSEFAALVSLVPACLNIQITPRTAPGEEAIGVFSFLMKLLARVVPVAFGTGVLYGTICVLLACYGVAFIDVGFVRSSEPVLLTAGQLAETLGAEAPVEDVVRPLFADYEGALATRIPVEQSALRAMRLIVVFALLPFAAYIVFLAYYLSVDLVRSVLTVPGKLDELLVLEEGKDRTGDDEDISVGEEDSGEGQGQKTEDKKNGGSKGTETAD